MKGPAFVVYGQRLAGEIDVIAQLQIRKLEAVNAGVDVIADMKRRANGIHRLPNADEPDTHIAVPRISMVESRDQLPVSLVSKQSCQLGVVLLSVNAKRSCDCPIQRFRSGKFGDIQDAAHGNQA